MRNSNNTSFTSTVTPFVTLYSILRTDQWKLMTKQVSETVAIGQSTIKVHIYRK